MNKVIIFAVVMGVLFFGYYHVTKMDAREMAVKSEKPENTAEAVFAGGCFWCTEADFEKLDGVIEAVSGYTGGSVADPSYEAVARGGTGHIESVKVLYDPDQIHYGQLLNYFWRHVDPTDDGGQFVDRGDQYRSAIFYETEQQRKRAEASRKRLAESGRFQEPIVTEILPLGPFYEAERYHQDYYRKNPLRYKFYRFNSGRDQFLEEVWGEDVSSTGPFSARERNDGDMEKDSPETSMSMKHDEGRSYMVPEEEQLRRQLTPMQYRVTQEDGTEPPFENQYWDNKAAGIYVDIVSGEPLFSSRDKFKSGTGWPSFTRPLEPDNIVEKTDRSFFMTRTEVRSKHADSHLGHVFEDGPEPTGLRYCINSAALRFIPAENLEAEGYGKYADLFE